MKNTTRRTNKKVRKKRVINFKKIIIFILSVYILIMLISMVFKKPITNIYIYNNKLLSDQEIIELAGISDYPSAIANLPKKIKSRLLKNAYIKDAEVKLKQFSEVHIKVEDNYPLFYNKNLNKTVLSDKREVKDKVIAPTLVNYIPDTIYDKFVGAMQTIDSGIVRRISEIEYSPNEVDDSRFLFYMNDGNHVYLTLRKFDNINSYMSIMESIIAKFGTKKGILNLDSGGYFDLFEQN